MATVGEIEYIVDVKTQAAIDAAKKMKGALSQMDSGMKESDQNASKLSAKMGGLASAVKKANGEISGQARSLLTLKSAIGGAIAALGVKTIIELADQYTDAAGRIKNVTASTEEYEMVQARLLKTANKTYRPLQEAQEVYIRTSGAIKDLGYSTTQALDITDSFSFLLVANAASAEKAGSAINAYSKAIQTGRVDSETWQSILSAMPKVVGDVANATGETEAKIRELGINGKLSLEALNEALLRSKGANEELVISMDTTVGDAVVALKNSMQVFVGKINEGTGATNGLVSVIERLAEKLQDPATIEAAQTLAAGVGNAFLGIISSLETVGGAAKFVGEEIAAATHGIASGDVVRAQEEVARLSEKLEGMEKILARMNEHTFDPFGDRARLTASVDEMRKKIALYKADIEATQQAEVRAIEARNAASRAEKTAAEEKAKADAEAAANAKKVAAEEKIAADNSRKASEAAREAARKRAAEEREAEAIKQRLIKAEQDNTNVIQHMKEALYQTTLNADQLAQRQAELSLNQYATPEQVAKVRALALEIKNLSDAKAFGEKVTGAGGTEAYVRGDAPQSSAVGLDDTQQRYADEAQRENDFYTGQLARLIEARESGLQTQQQYDAMLEELYRAHNERMADIDKARLEAQLSQWGGGLSQMADDIKSFSDAVGVENKKMFAVMKAAAIAGAIIDTYKAATSAYASLAPIPVVGPALGAAAAVAAVAAGMGRVAKIKAQNMGRRSGGVVTAGQFYRVNEGGKPEIFQGADGSQYMMPTQNGDVISNQQAQSGAPTSVSVIVNLNENKQKAGQVSQSKDDQSRTVIDIFVADIMGDGRSAGVIQNKWGLQPRGT